MIRMSGKQYLKTFFTQAESYMWPYHGNKEKRHH